MFRAALLSIDLLCATPAAAKESQGVLAGSGQSWDYISVTFIDTMTAQYNGDVITIWEYTVTATLSGNSNLEFSAMSLMEYNCKTSKYRNIHNTIYGNKFPQSEDTPNASWSYVVPGTKGMQSYRITCGFEDGMALPPRYDPKDNTDHIRRSLRNSVR